MKRLLSHSVLALTLVAASSSLAQAQPVGGVIFGGAGALLCCSGSTLTLEGGGGVDLPVAERASVSADLSLLGALDERSRESNEIFQSVRYFSLTTSVHVSPHSARSGAFVLGGLGGGFAGGPDGVALGYVFGGGVDWPLDVGKWIRLEVRDQPMGNYSTHLVLVRIGLLFR